MDSGTVVVLSFVQVDLIVDCVFRIAAGLLERDRLALATASDVDSGTAVVL